MRKSILNLSPNARLNFFGSLGAVLRGYRVPENVGHPKHSDSLNARMEMIQGFLSRADETESLLLELEQVCRPWIEDYHKSKSSECFVEDHLQQEHQSTIRKTSRGDIQTENHTEDRT